MQPGCASQRQERPKASKSSSETTSEKRVVHFDFGKKVVRSEDKPTLDRVAAWLKGDKKSLAIVEGHTDQIGSNSYNDILAEDRARSVRVYLRDQGADPKQITITSKGKREPIVKSGRGHKAQAPNRRAEIYMSLAK